MEKTVSAVYENGVLRPLEALPLKERQRVSITVSDGLADAWLDHAYMASIDAMEEVAPSLEEVRRILSKIPGNLSDDVRAERDSRGQASGREIFSYLKLGKIGQDTLRSEEPTVMYHVDIPESVARSLRLPAGEIEPRLRTELAVALYAQGILPFGKATELSGVSRFAFAEFVGQRNIPRHYDDDDLAQDLDYARGQ